MHVFQIYIRRALSSQEDLFSLNMALTIQQVTQPPDAVYYLQHCFSRD